MGVKNSTLTSERKKSNNISTLADTGVLLDVLGNETRRRILNLISHEPMYFNQLAKEVRTGQQAILRHVKILEDTGLIESYAMRSDLGAPDRKYYRVNSSFNLSISVSNDNFTIRNEDIEELRYKEADNLYKKFDELHSITFIQNDRVDQTVNKDKIKDTKRRQIVSLGQALSKLQKNLEDTEGQILHLESRLNDLRALKQAIIKKMHDIEKENFDDIERRIMCLLLEGPIHQNEGHLTVSEIAEMLDKNERTIKNAMSRITDRLENGSSIYELFKNIS
jgi:ArsR family transcriptional regulator